jgi:hypothetical protein
MTRGFNYKKMNDLFLKRREQVRSRNKNLKKVVLDKKISSRIKLGLLKYGFDVSDEEN